MRSTEGAPNRCRPTSSGITTRAPGPRAALFGFVTFVRERHGVDLVVPKRKRALRATDLRRAEERRLNQLLDEVPGAADFERQWLTYSLAYFHRVSLVKAKQLLANGTITGNNEGHVLAPEVDHYWPAAAARAGGCYLATDIEGFQTPSPARADAVRFAGECRVSGSDFVLTL